MAKYTVKHLQTGTISIFLGIPMFIQHIFRLTYTTLRLQAIAEKIYLLCYIDHKIHRLSKITSTSIVRIWHHKATAIRVLYNNINFYHLNSKSFSDELHCVFKKHRRIFAYGYNDFVQAIKLPIRNIKRETNKT